MDKVGIWDKIIEFMSEVYGDIDEIDDCMFECDISSTEAEAVNNNHEIAREYGILESMVRKWRNQQHVLFSGELKITAKRASMGCYRPKDPEVDQQLADWFSDQRSQGKNCSLNS